jgi:prepilin-type processing-associated H-X9-DG protein
MGETIPMDWAEGESRRFAQAKDPANTVFFTESQDWNEPFRGYYGITAPAMFQYVATYDSAYIIFTSVTPCSGDWCIDTDPSKAGQQKSTATIYTGYENGSNVSFLDGHSRYMKDLQLAAGTNYPEATPQDFGVGRATGEFTPLGGSVLTDKSKYLWNLDDNYFGG